jgi:hypothetical protein
VRKWFQFGEEFSADAKQESPVARYLLNGESLSIDHQQYAVRLDRSGNVYGLAIAGDQICFAEPDLVEPPSTTIS